MRKGSWLNFVDEESSPSIRVYLHTKYMCSENVFLHSDSLLFERNE